MKGPRLRTSAVLGAVEVVFCAARGLTGMSEGIRCAAPIYELPKELRDAPSHGGAMIVFVKFL
jgi:hypothetical protein